MQPGLEDQLGLYQKRIPIFTRSVEGKFRRFKTAVLALGYAVFFLLPWLPWTRLGAPAQALLFDLPGRRFLIFGLTLGFYDGFFGPGTGNFWMIAYVLLLGFNLKKATAYTKWVNFTSNIVALLFFAIGGKILVLPGIVMAVGQFGNLGRISRAGLGIAKLFKNVARLIDQRSTVAPKHNSGIRHWEKPFVFRVRQSAVNQLRLASRRKTRRVRHRRTAKIFNAYFLCSQSQYTV